MPPGEAVWHLIVRMDAWSIEGLTSTAFIPIVKALAPFSDLEVDFYIKAGDMRSSFHPKGKYGLASPELESMLREWGAKPLKFLAAGSNPPKSSNAIHNLEVSIGAYVPSRWRGIDSPAHVRVTLADRVVYRMTTANVSTILQLTFDICEDIDVVSGIVELARVQDAIAGKALGTTWPAHAPLRRWLDQHSWLAGWTKGDRVRGIGWGNYLGNRVLDRLGGRSLFIESYRRIARMANGEPNALIWEFERGVFISLSKDPLDTAPDRALGLHPAAERNALWLNEEFGRKGVTNHWSDEHNS